MRGHLQIVAVDTDAQSIGPYGKFQATNLCYLVFAQDSTLFLFLCPCFVVFYSTLFLKWGVDLY